MRRFLLRTILVLVVVATAALALLEYRQYQGNRKAARLIVEFQVERVEDLGLIAVSSHDSSDEVIEWIRGEFGEAHRYVRVGEEIVVNP